MRNGALPFAPENPQVGVTGWRVCSGRRMSMNAVSVADTDGSSVGKLIGLPALRKVQLWPCAADHATSTTAVSSGRSFGRDGRWRRKLMAGRPRLDHLPIEIQRRRSARGEARGPVRARTPQLMRTPEGGVPPECLVAPPGAARPRRPRLASFSSRGSGDQGVTLTVTCCRCRRPRRRSGTWPAGSGPLTVNVLS